jgi:hypothetical protein
MPFSHDVAGGQGNLIITSLKSPNYVHGVSGWAVNKDGSAEFQDVVLPEGSGGAVVTFAASAPSSPNTGDLWYNTADGLEVSQWNGSAWVAYQIGTGAIANAAITVSQLAGSVTARSIGGVTTTIAATAPGSPLAGDLWIDSANGYQIQQYSGSAWTPISWNAGDVIQAGTITATQIAANTITATQIAAGTILAGAVNGTTITGATINGGTFNGTNWVENATGMFLYNGTPAAGNLVASIAPASGTDSHGNAYVEGVAIYGPNGQNAVLSWFSGATLEPIFYMTPQTSKITQPYSSPFIDTTAANLGAANEYLRLFIASGTPSAPGTLAGLAEIALNSMSKDGTIPAVAEFYGGTAGDLMAAVTDNGIVAANPTSANTYESWHPITLDSGWSAGSITPAYRLLPDGNLQLIGQATRSGIAGSANVNNSNPLPAAYRPPGTVNFYAYETAFNRAHMTINSSGVITASSSGTVTGTWFAELNAIIPLTS